MNLALFDFDGTITSSDTWTPFMRFAVPPVRLIAGQLLLTPVFVGHRIGVVSSSRGRQIATRVAFQGEKSAAVRQLGLQYATTMIPNTVRRLALERIDWHRSQADHVVIVSASLDVYLGPWCETRGLDVICTTLEEHDGRLTGRCMAIPLHRSRFVVVASAIVWTLVGTTAAQVPDKPDFSGTRVLADPASAMPDAARKLTVT